MIGYSAFCRKGITWRINQGGALPLSPGKKLNQIDLDLVKSIREDKKLLFVRWESEFDIQGVTEWWHIIKDSFDDLSELPKKTRYMIRKASKEYEVRRMSRLKVIEVGYSVYKAAYQRYQTHEPMYSREEFRNAVAELPERTEFWGVYEKEGERLVAFSENYVEDNICFYVSMWLEPESMAKFAGYLLFHEMELNYLRDRRFQYVSDGTRSLSHDTNIHDFLLRKFNFRKAYSTLNVVYTPWLKVLINCCYPLRKMINKVQYTPFKKASVLLKQEEIRRAREKARA
ncbi:GNAT family N-acetyltransferase [Idiomarina piscisalsi]|uniref:GNAT family N-acetyltransferase n=1 Tax=Idiomarina piscisalsi TaxID=1096243 RepID=UPI001383D268|nr:GNAT family N-acetyltransferase [Idiomarina piscisalsi]MTJ02276.1 hypothetical protein [Idiomarina piscisalsi]